jgi:lipoprotein-anchoring transpeptidase ErfK/SrfK
MGSQVTTTSGATRLTRRRTLLTAAGAAAVAALLALTACSTGGPSGTHSSGVSDNGTVPAGPSDPPGSSDPTGSSAPQQDGSDLAAIQTSPSGGDSVNPTTPVTVSVSGGKLTSVTMHNGAGKEVTGELATDGSSWHTTEVLGYGKTYTVTAQAVNAAGTPSTKTSEFTTLTPANQTMPYIDDLYGAGIKNGGTYGVAMVVNVVFDEPITHRAAAEKALKVTTSPHVDGSWYWTDNQHVHWRPENYYQPGTKVTVDAQVYGVKVGAGLYGQTDVSRTFTIGRKQETIAYDTAPKSVNKVKVYRSGKLIRTMNTSMGEHSGITVNGNYINFYTLDGTYTVLGFENPANMCSDSYGLPANAPGGYACEDIYWATKISTDGIYLHELDTTVWDQDHGQDVSHGCLNLNYANAHWFYTHSLVGDPVTVHGAKGAPKLQLWQGGDWSVPWSKWLAGSALT